MTAMPDRATLETPTSPTGTDSGEPDPTLHGAWDWWLFGSALLLLGLGLLMMLSSSSLKADAEYGNALHFVTRQTVGITIGLVLGAFALVLPWQLLRDSRWLVWLTMIAMLGAVWVPGLGNEANGAHRWIHVGFINLQPSGYAKVAIIWLVADHLARNQGRLHDFAVLLPALAIPAPIIGLVLAEPDFGSTVILSSLVGLLLFVAGLPWKWLGLLGVGGVGALGFIAVLEPYRVRRLMSFLDPFSDVEGAGYQVVQGFIALGSGGWAGQGLGTGVAQRGFLPEAHTDFISAVVGEELGGVGWVGMVALYLLLVWRGTHIAARAHDLFGSLVAIGVTTLLGMQAIVNLGVVVGWMPAKGLVLPFMSYGASEISVHVLSIALLLRIGLEGRRGMAPPVTDPRSQG